MKQAYLWVLIWHYGNDIVRRKINFDCVIFFLLCRFHFQRLVQSLRSESFNAAESSNEYTSAETGDTVLQNTQATEEPVCEKNVEEVIEKTETEVFIQPTDEIDPVNVWMDELKHPFFRKSKFIWCMW